VVFGAVCGDELVHDAATCADKLVLSPLAKASQDGSRIGDADEVGDGEGGSYLECGGTGEAGTEGNISPQAQAEGGDCVALACEYGHDPERIIGPVMAGCGWEGSGVEGSLCLVVLRIEDDFAV
jgi:hypothetical protein